ncbi:MAG: hypothetical protein U9Q69_03655 [Nanoarchaeota archaeon]|nr:hypothetical protein [Nanoarchaeota archaeon]
MKRGIILLFIILFSSLAIADEIVLIYPSEKAFTETRDITFICNVTSLSEISNVNLYLGNETAFTINSTEAVTGIEVSAEFHIKNIPDGTYYWNCEANLVNASAFISKENQTFIMEYIGDNTPPELILDIPNQTWEKNTKEYLNLSKYFSDSDKDSLIFWSAGAVNIFIDIEDNGIAKFTPKTGWSGTASTKFYATDGKTNTSSNQITLTVVDNEKINWSKIEKENNKIKLTAINVYPIEKPFIYFEPTNFSVDVLSASEITCRWHLNDEVISTSASSSYVLKSIEEGSHTLKVIIANKDNETITQSWTVKKEAEEIIEETVEKEPILSPPQDSSPKNENQLFILLGSVIGGIIALILISSLLFHFIKKDSNNQEEKPKLIPLSSIEKASEDKKEEKASEDKKEEKASEDKKEEKASEVEKEEKPSDLN